MSVKHTAELERLAALRYVVEISERSGVCYAYVPELGLLVCDEDLNQAYVKLQVEKTTYFSRMVEIGISDQVPLPAPSRRRRALVDGLLQFGLKSLILSVVIGVVILASVPLVDAFVVKRLSNVPRAAVLLLDKQVGRVVSRLENLSDDERGQLLADLRDRVRILRPFYLEVERLWDEADQDSISEQSRGKEPR